MKPFSYVYHLLPAVAFALTMSSCGNASSGASDSSGDTIAADSAVADSVPAEEPALRFASATEAVSYMRESGNWDKYRTGILPQMALDHLDYAIRLLDSDFDNFLIVDKAKMKVFFYDRYGRVIKSYGMACSRRYGTKHKHRDNRTSEGFFSVEGVYNSSEWLYTDDDGNTSKVKGQFGPRFIRLLIPGTRAIGIHGTNAPWSIGGRRSHGCIRLTNENILDLAPRVKVGMPVIVSPSPRDMAVNISEGYDIPSVATEPGTPRAIASSLHEHSQENSSKTDSIGNVYHEAAGDSVLSSPSHQQTADSI